MDIYQDIYFSHREDIPNMMKAKIFNNGRSQAVRLPKECRFDCDEVLVNKIGDMVILMPKGTGWENFIKGIEMFPDDFMKDGRNQGEFEKREEIK